MNGRVVFAAVMLLGVLVTGCTTSRAPPAPSVPNAPHAPSAPKAPQSLPPQSLPPDSERSQEKTGVRESAADDLDNVLKYFGALRMLPGNDFRREQDSARQAFAQTPSDLNRMRLALVMSLAANAQKDERRALELLEPMTKGARSEYTPLRGFALVIQSFVREQVKLGSNAQAMKDKLDQLMSLEKSLAERERTAPGAGR